ncbi:hypothetical protein F0562_017205 [Nyssa sinensis]|uniref:Uncharacterized protein n=1 Tax=Nyssa sinensis TaxID=561372 RepID=A0A5J4ZIA1_9ASTE|nr:hypothetical protein F0562_017205 [Nyssa sinensis]
MADGAKYVPINGGTLISDLNSLFSLLRTKKTMAFVYGFMFAFIGFTVFLAFNPSSNSSPWFTNIFPSSTSSSTATNFSFFFPQQVHNLSSSPSQNTTRSQNITLQSPIINKEPVMVNNQTQNTELQHKVEVLKPNQSKIESPQSPAPANQTTNSVPKSSSNPKTITGNGEKRSPETPKTPVPANQSANPVPQSYSNAKNITGSGEKIIPENASVSNFTSPSKKQSNGTNSGVSVKQKKEDLVESLIHCNLFDGEWVRDDSYPLYKPGSCSLIDEQFNCYLNGRPDSGYQKLKWKPNGCNLPRLNGSHMLELLRGKRLVFVGDSLNRNMWESLVCILRNSVKDQSKVFEASGRHHFRSEASYSFIFKDYNCSVEFFVSPFLVQEWEMPEKNGSKKETLRLDIVERSADQYKTADIIIFNTGHWWTHEKTSKGKDYYQEGSHVYGELDVDEAFRRALTTWARWVDANVNPSKSLVFFRGYSASHFSGGQWNSGGQCDNETEPIKNKKYLSQYPPKMTVLERVLKGMKTHVSYMNVTTLTGL